jgi:hypothetical protein
MDNGFPFHSKQNYYFEHHHKVKLDWFIDKHFGSKNLQHVEIVVLSKHARKYNLKKMAIMGWSSLLWVFLPNFLQCGACKKFRVLI